VSKLPINAPAAGLYVPSKVTLVRYEEGAKALSPMVSTLAGIIMLENNPC
jgi:hypothetical protein